MRYLCSTENLVTEIYRFTSERFNNNTLPFVPIFREHFSSLLAPEFRSLP